MEACARWNKRMIVLDRPNPVNGRQVEGNLLHPEYSSFVGLYPIPMRHGMTTAELALFFNSEFEIDCDLTVVAMEGWRREYWFDQTQFTLGPTLTQPSDPGFGYCLSRVRSGRRNLPLGGAWNHASLRDDRSSVYQQSKVCLALE